MSEQGMSQESNAMDNGGSHCTCVIRVFELPLVPQGRCDNPQADDSPGTDAGNVEVFRGLVRCS